MSPKQFAYFGEKTSPKILCSLLCSTLYEVVGNHIIQGISMKFLYQNGNVLN